MTSSRGPSSGRPGWGSGLAGAASASAAAEAASGSAASASGSASDAPSCPADHQPRFDFVRWRRARKLRRCNRGPEPPRSRGVAMASWSRLERAIGGFAQRISLPVLPPSLLEKHRAQMKSPSLNRFCAALVALSALHASVADAQSFDVPQGFVASPDGEPWRRGEWRSILTVRPAEGSFSELSRISLREVLGPVDDPDTWLRARLTAEMPDEAAAE